MRGTGSRIFAKQYHAGVADFWGTMNTVNEEQRKNDPLFSVVGPNRVHPLADRPFRNGIRLSQSAEGPARSGGGQRQRPQRRKPDHESNCSIDKVTASKTAVEFDALEKALPMVVPEEARPALKLVPFEGRFNQEIVKVSGLRKGAYTLKIDQNG